MTYEEWALKVISVIANGNQNINGRMEEIKCVANHDGSYPESFESGETPKDAWQTAFEGWD